MQPSRISSLMLLALLLLALAPASADRGMMVMKETLEENIDVYDVGQKAILCWNAGEEVMVLSTDKYASQDTRVLEFLPLPSKPSVVEKADGDDFQVVAELIRLHRPAVQIRDADGYGRSKGPRGAANEAGVEPAVEIVFHKKIGAHDITIGEVKRMKGFEDWVRRFVAAQKLPYDELEVRRLKPVVENYLARGIRYFVFDVVELTKEKKSIEPVLYRFKTPQVYFPLIVTTLSQGETNVALYLLTPFKTDIWGTRTGFVSGFYTLDGTVDYNYPVKFPINRSELARFSGSIRDFFAKSTSSREGSGELWFSTAKFTGPTSAFKRDFQMKPRP